MKTYFVDANIFLRFLLQDNKKLAQAAKEYFFQAKSGKIKLILIPEIVLEISYVLQKVYHLPKDEMLKYLLVLVKTPYIQVEKREILIKTFEIYTRVNIDIVDIFLYVSAKKDNAAVLSFDKDFDKLKEKSML